jgi:hypothetical protein
MAIDPAETRSWAEKNKAAWELVPLVEVHHGEQVQVGYELDLYARAPTELADREDRESAMEATWDRLREIAESLVPADSRVARIDVDPFEAAACLRPETGFAPEVLLKARLFHASDYFAPVSKADRERLKALEDRLHALGLRSRTW